jgi:hypothetical protein
MNQLMAASHAYTQPSHTHAPHQSCSHCYYPSHRIYDCSFINHYMIEANNFVHENVQTTITLISEEKTVNKVEEKEEQIEPPSTPKLFNGKELSSETHSFVTIPLETQHEPQASPFQRLKEPS